MLGTVFAKGMLGVEDKPFSGTKQLALHVKFLDAVFSFKRNMISPYPGSRMESDVTKNIFNYKLSYVWKLVVCTITILVHKFICFPHKSKSNPAHVDI
jgi:hypothetical protein